MKKRIFILCLLFISFQNYVLGEEIPSYLKGYEDIYNKNPRQAALQWFKNAKSGLFVCFSPASQLAGGTQEWLQLDNWHKVQKQFEMMDRYSRKSHLRDKLTTVFSGVESLVRSFNPVNFNADSIADLAVSAGMKYVTFTTQHVVGKMFMFDTSISPWNSQKLLKRDFVKELSIACEKRGLGLFLYVTPPNDYIQEEVRTILKELLTCYGNIAGIWFDGIGECYRRPNDFMESSRLYSYIRQLQPQCLISFKTGYTGDEDFLAPEWTQVKFDANNYALFNINVPTEHGTSLYEETSPRNVLRITDNGFEYRKQCFNQVWKEELSRKPIELCNPMLQNQEWFDVKEGIHKTVNEIWTEYEYTCLHDANYLLSIGLRGDGSVHPSDSKVLKEFGLLRNK